MIVKRIRAESTLTTSTLVGRLVRAKSFVQLTQKQTHRLNAALLWMDKLFRPVFNIKARSP